VRLSRTLAAGERGVGKRGPIHCRARTFDIPGRPFDGTKYGSITFTSSARGEKDRQLVHRDVRRGDRWWRRGRAAPLRSSSISAAEPRWRRRDFEPS